MKRYDWNNESQEMRQEEHGEWVYHGDVVKLLKTPQPEQAEASSLSDLLIGDLNQGVGDNLEVVNVSGDTDGYGLPNSVMIKTKTTGCIKKYIPEG